VRTGDRLRFARQVRFLRRAGAPRVPHSGASLLDHLVGTYEVLARWGGRRQVRDAALFHSVYGTQFLDEALLDEGDRAIVRRLIGAEAEELAWLWHAVDRSSLGRGGIDSIVLRDGTPAAICSQQRVDLVEIALADFVEQARRQPPATMVPYRRALWGLAALASAAAADDAREVLSSTPPVVHLYAACWNEIDMLEFFFRHYDPWIDRYVIYDDGSTDGSVTRLAQHPRVEVRRLVRTRPDSLVLSLLDLYQHVWKESRGQADWVVVVNVDEHLQHPDMPAYLHRCAAAGVTAIPGLGYQMVSETWPPPHLLLYESVRRGVPWDLASKLAIFDPDAIDEVNYSVGRHVAEPAGRVVYPDRDEVLNLHFKYLDLDRLGQRHAAQASRLEEGDVARNFAFHYRWDDHRRREAFTTLVAAAVEPLGPASRPHADHAEPRWWR
jgi:hypothetical protein